MFPRLLLTAAALLSSVSVSTSVACEPFGVSGTLAGETPGPFLSAAFGTGTGAVADPDATLTSVRAMALPGNSCVDGARYADFDRRAANIESDDERDALAAEQVALINETLPLGSWSAFFSLGSTPSTFDAEGETFSGDDTNMVVRLCRQDSLASTSGSGDALELQEGTLCFMAARPASTITVIGAGAQLEIASIGAVPFDGDDDDSGEVSFRFVFAACEGISEGVQGFRDDFAASL